MTPDQLQFTPASFLLSSPDDAQRMSFERALDANEDVRWSARRTLIFIMGSNSLLWWIIGYALHVMA